MDYIYQLEYVPSGVVPSMATISRHLTYSDAMDEVRKLLDQLLSGWSSFKVVHIKHKGTVFEADIWVG